GSDPARRARPGESTPSPLAGRVHRCDDRPVGMRRSRRLLASLALGLYALTGQAGRALPASRQRLQVDYSGCRQVLLPGPACVLNDDRTLTLWVDLPPEIEIEIEAG